MNYEEYYDKHDELTRLEIENKKYHQIKLTELEQNRAEKVRIANEEYQTLKTIENNTYLHTQEDLREQKRKLKRQFLIEKEQSTGEATLLK